MLKAIPIILKGDELSYHSANTAECRIYVEDVKILKGFYNCEEKKVRILTKWKRMTFTEEMTEYIEESEISLFQRFVAKPTSLPKDIDLTYHAYNYLREWLLTVVEFENIKTTLRDRMPKTSHDVVNRVLNKLSDTKKSAGGQ